MDEKTTEERAEEIAKKLRRSSSPKEIYNFKRKYKKEGRGVIRKEADERVNDDLDDREEIVESVTDIVIKGLEKLPF